MDRINDEVLTGIGSINTDILHVHKDIQNVFINSCVLSRVDNL